MAIALPLRRLLIIPLLTLSMGTPLIANDSDDGEAASSSTNAAEEQRPYLGIQFDRTHDGDGVRVGRVFPNSTASRMGIERNDVITAINDTTIDSASQLQDIINNSSVGEDISVTWQRDGEEQQGQAALASLPRQRLEARQLAELRENVRSLQSQRAALQGAGDDDAISVAEAMHGLATTLNELPERIEQAAQQFKELYPDGSFTVHIEIDIRTNAKEENPFDISPQQGANDGDTADTAKEGAATDEDNIAEEAEDAEEDDENPDQEE